MDLLEVEVGFTLRGFAEGDDADFIFGLRVNDRNWHAGQKTKRLVPLFTIVKSVVFKGVGRAFKDAWSVEEVEAVILEVDRACAQTKERHEESVATCGSYGKSGWFFGGLTDIEPRYATRAVHDLHERPRRLLGADLDGLTG